MLAWVFNVFHTRSTVVMLTLFKSLVRSILEYCSPLWNPFKVAEIQELECFQRTFASRIDGLQHLHYWDRLKKLSLMSLQRRRERYIILYMWKILNKSTSNNLNIQFNQRHRLGVQAIVPPIRKKSSQAFKTLYENSFSVKGPKLWNSIPYDLTGIKTLDDFKSKLTKFLLLIPDKPPIRGYSNYILAWHKDREATSLWGGRSI